MRKEREIPTNPNAIIDELVRLQRLEDMGIKTPGLQERLWDELQKQLDEIGGFRNIGKYPSRGE